MHLDHMFSKFIIGGHCNRMVLTTDWSSGARAKGRIEFEVGRGSTALRIEILPS